MSVTYMFRTDSAGVTVTVYAADASGAPTGGSVASGTTGTDAAYATALAVGDYVGTWTAGGYSRRTSGETSRRDPDYLAAAQTAAETSYDHTVSGLAATNVKAALDEITARVVALETP